jgi:hypothetical protein
VRREGGGGGWVWFDVGLLLGEGQGGVGGGVMCESGNCGVEKRGEDWAGRVQRWSGVLLRMHC